MTYTLNPLYSIKNVKTTEGNTCLPHRHNNVGLKKLNVRTMTTITIPIEGTTAPQNTPTINVQEPLDTAWNNLPQGVPTAPVTPPPSGEDLAYSLFNALEGLATPASPVADVMTQVAALSASALSIVAPRGLVYVPDPDVANGILQTPHVTDVAIGMVAPPSTPGASTIQESVITSGNNILNALPQLQSSLDTVATDIAANPITTQISEIVSMLFGQK